jgi:hypothetical protein
MYPGYELSIIPGAFLDIKGIPMEKPNTEPCIGHVPTSLVKEPASYRTPSLGVEEQVPKRPRMFVLQVGV